MTAQQRRVLAILEDRRHLWTRTDHLAEMLNSTPGSMKVMIYRLRKDHKIHIITDGCSQTSKGYRLA